jgi:hypothetical protein
MHEYPKANATEPEYDEFDDMQEDDGDSVIVTK